MTCTAKRSNGQACKALAIKGARVCRVHGGSAPQVIQAARRRLLTLVDPALGVLAQCVRPRTPAARKHWEPTAQEIAAARDVLTRAGIGAIVDEQDDGQVLWEEFVEIHRRRVATPAA